jgi:hypothetical protein
MSFIHSKSFKYLKNFIIGAGASVVLLGALFKIQSWKGADQMLTYGMIVEAGLFLLLGILGPEKTYYWEKAYPGLDEYGGRIDGALNASAGKMNLDINTAKMEGQLDNMLGELRTMANSMNSLKALQEVDFKGAGDQIKKMGQFYSNLNEAMANINESIEDTRMYKQQLGALNKNLGSLNTVYGNILSAMSNPLGK